ncbi:heme lyase CcmF/NrfE family subunit, partial [Mesorhizobium sp.]|uniref:heme lyase CcmF/NrfE family subunit n=1 Tax=Mesorhizobium sp. TaxID=1871066 RepID=UPI0025C12F26
MVETGHFALVLAFALSLVQMLVPLVGARADNQRLMAVGGPVAVTGFALTALSFTALATAYAGSDFSVASVWENSHSLQPMIYKITGTWGNHEGSMLLWVLILTFFGALVAVFGSNLPATLKANVLAVQGMLGAAFFLFILATSNPFIRLNPAPIEGRDLNPILQDLGLAIHPPLLYLGYVGFSICFSFSVAALIEGRIDASWARWVRPWTLVAWMFLTGGIAMGSYWAYYELGWGGFWFWDPVENASFMPWLAGTALLHSAIVMEKRSALKIWTLLLAILTFSLSLLGTFLVRSGVLTSVHAFATDPARGVFILCILTLFIGGSLALFALRASTLTAGGLFQPISREGALVLNNLFLTTATATVLVGTLYPLALEAITGALTDLAVKSGIGSVAPADMLRRFAGLPRSVFGTALAHLGLGLTLLGIVGTLSFGTEKILTMRAGETVELSGHTLRFEGLFPQKGPNFTEERGRFLLIGADDNADGEITSAKRFYPVRQTVTTESGIRTLGVSQLYLSLGDEGKDGSVVVRLWWKPLVTLIWGGGLVMMAGAAMSLLDRRLRV